PPQYATANMQSLTGAKEQGLNSISEIVCAHPALTTWNQTLHPIRTNRLFRKVDDNTPISSMTLR
ncbi:hypothetical protein, partial [Aestuariivita boseongensis]|uniref:hypothetical protein n=1 Tax=Aestuariivita boseongensis TaxID=1470562 RepID=UPI001C128AEE